MKSLMALSLLAACTLLSASMAQNTAAHPSPQTQGAVPSGLGQGTGAVQAGTAATVRDSSARGAQRGSGRAAPTDAQTRRAAGAPARPASQGQSGITGVPEYAPGSSRETDSKAPAATSRVIVTGDQDGNGILDRSSTGPDSAALLPGLTLKHNSLDIAAGTPVQVRLQEAVDSGHAKNGQMVNGSLAAPLGTIPDGAPVQLTVVAVARAGEISSRGELSLQVVTVNGKEMLSEVITAEGREGTKILPDDAPARGTEALFTPDQTITLPAS